MGRDQDTDGQFHFQLLALKTIRTTPHKTYWYSKSNVNKLLATGMQISGHTDCALETAYADTERCIHSNKKREHFEVANTHNCIKVKKACICSNRFMHCAARTYHRISFCGEG